MGVGRPYSSQPSLENRVSFKVIQFQNNGGKKKVSAGTKKLEKLSMNPKTLMTKEHKAVTHWMKENIPTKKTKFLHSHVVDYFTGSKAVEFLDTLLRYKMFHRAKKIAVNTEEKKKRKIRLDMHLEQMFVDNSDAFVWLYDPIPWYYWILGGGICMIVIIFCLFPLWPKKIRKGAGWLSWIAVLFLLAVLVVGIIKYLLFSVPYILSARKLRFWIMPNLTKDVGFIKSFWPLYEYSYTGEYVGDVTEDNETEEKPPISNDSDSNESG